MYVESFSTYYFFKALRLNEMCSMCLETAKEDISKGWVAHSNGGVLHPIHEKCAAIWAGISDTCMICRAPVDNSFFVSKSTTWEKIGEFLLKVDNLFLMLVGLGD